MVYYEENLYGNELIFVFDASVAPGLSYLCKLLRETLQLPVFFRTEADIPEESFWSAGLPAHPAYADPYELYRAVICVEKDLRTPIVHETDLLEQFAVVPVKRNGSRVATIVLGPAARLTPNDALFLKLLDDYSIPSRERHEWVSYWNGLPTVDRLRFLHVCAAANWMLNQEALDVTDIIQSSFQSEASLRRKEKEREIADWREYSHFVEGIESTSQMLDFIRRGKKTELMKQLAIATSGQAPVGTMANRGHLRNVKNLAIGGITMSSRAATEGGLHEALAGTLCELHIRHIEELNDLGRIEAAVFGAIVDFADRVDQCRKLNVSKPVRLAMDYIYLHLYEDISPERLSSVTRLNAQYLSQLIKKETGLSLTNYIQKQRIEEAKRLLDYFDDPISTIGSRLTFYDQAHFVKVFKKHAGVTPKQYRNRGK